MFKPVLEIKSNKGVLHFRRWKIIETPWFAIYIHAIYQADKDKHMHDHPWDYCSIIFKGEYMEHYMEMPNNSVRMAFRNQRMLRDLFKPWFWGRLFKMTPYSRFHKVEKLFSPVVRSLVITGPVKHDWGYWTGKNHIQHDIYRTLKNQGFFIK